MGRAELDVALVAVRRRGALVVYPLTQCVVILCVRLPVCVGQQLVVVIVLTLTPGLIDLDTELRSDQAGILEAVVALDSGLRVSWAREYATSAQRR